jgi:hypothetical protein
MATTLLHLRSTTPGAVPTAEQLAVGELAVNLADKKWFTKKAGGTIVCLNQLTVLDGGEITDSASVESLSLWRAEAADKIYHWSM